MCLIPNNRNSLNAIPVNKDGVGVLIRSPKQETLTHTNSKPISYRRIDAEPFKITNSQVIDYLPGESSPDQACHSKYSYQ